MNQVPRLLVAALLAFTAFALPTNALAAGPGWQGESFQKVFHFYGPSGKGGLSGKGAANAKPIADTDIMSIEAGTIITKVYVIVDAAITGTTDMVIGDDDSANGFMAVAVMHNNLATAGLYNWNAGAAGAYLRSQAAISGGTDVYVVPQGKYYSVSGKEVKLDTTGTNVAGSFRVVVEGFKVGA